VSDFERKRLAKAFKVQTVDEQRSFSGHGSVFDDPHPTSSWALPMDWQDVMKPGAFRRTLADHKKLGTSPALLFQHDTDNPIGAYANVAEDGDGLLLEGKIAQSAKTPAGADIYELMAMGGLNGLSIGFRAVKSKLDEKAKTREILEVELWEVSVVTIPGQSSARVADVKALREDPTQLKRHLESSLRDAGLSRTEAKAVLARGFPGLGMYDPTEVAEAIMAVAAGMRA
jgi:hypothetical protein